MRKAKFALCIGMMLGIFIIIYLFANPISSIYAVNAAFALSVSLIVFIMVLTVFLGPIGPLFVRQNLERIGLVNRKGEAPFLLWIRTNPKDKSCLQLVFENRHIPRDKWEDNRTAIEAALNVFIVKIADGKNRRQIIVDVVPASHGLPDFIEWRQDYLPDGDFILRLGEGLSGPIETNLNVVPHLLIGGSTGSGKSVLLRLLLAQCLAKDAIVHLADFKGGMDYSHFQHPSFHLLIDIDSFIALLAECVEELNTRKEILRRAGCSNLKEYNAKNPLHQHRRIIIACDEVAEVLDKTGLPKEFKDRIDRVVGYLSTIARQGRAVGIHLILATQRPDANVLAGQIKNNMDCRICGRADLVLSQIILDNGDANDAIPKDAQGRFIMHDGTVFQGYWSDI